MSLDDLLQRLSAKAGQVITPQDLTPDVPSNQKPDRPGAYAVRHAAGSWTLAQFMNDAWSRPSLNAKTAQFVWRGLAQPVSSLIAYPQGVSPGPAAAILGNSTVKLEFRHSPEPRSPAETLDWARKTLTAMREQVLSSLASVPVGSVVPSAGGDEVDRANAISETDTLLRGRAALVLRLREIDEALRRAATGEFGICEATGDEIPFGRLQANPLARFTVEHQASLEKLSRQHA
jgi:RNA polymerase-binding transcription factor DksA